LKGIKIIVFRVEYGSPKNGLRVLVPKVENFALNVEVWR